MADKSRRGYKWFIAGHEDGGNEIIKLDPKTRNDLSLSWQVRSTTGPFDTAEEAEKRLAHDSGQPTTKCVYCGYLISFGYYGWEQLAKRKACFTCNHWLDAVERYRRGNMLVIGNGIFSDGGRRSRNYSGYDTLGFGGREFLIEKFDGTTISTNNLWGGGIIPDKWKPQLPDNAKFIDGKQGWVKVGDTWCMG